MQNVVKIPEEFLEHNIQDGSQKNPKAVTKTNMFLQRPEKNTQLRLAKLCQELEKWMAIVVLQSHHTV